MKKKDKPFDGGNTENLKYKGDDQTIMQAGMMAQIYTPQLKKILVTEGGDKFVEAGYKLMDECLDAATHIEKFRISCKKGCSGCCHLSVAVSQQEADYIARYCKEKNIPIDKEYLNEQLKHPPEYISLTPVGPCVFLKDNLCSIYEARPIECRAHRVVGSPDNCAPDKPDAVVQHLITKDVAAAAMAFLGVINNKRDRFPKVLLKALNK